MPDKHSHIDPELIRKYLAGELDNKAMHALERQALDDPFLAEALEGYAAFEPDQHAHLADLQGRLEQRVTGGGAGSEGSGGEGAAKVVGKVVGMSYRWAAAAAAIVVLGAGLFWMSRQQVPVQKEIAKAEEPAKQAPPAPQPDSAATAPLPDAATTLAKDTPYKAKKEAPEQEVKSAPTPVTQEPQPAIAAAEAAKQDVAEWARQDTNAAAQKRNEDLAAVPTANATDLLQDKGYDQFYNGQLAITQNKATLPDTLLASALKGKMSGLNLQPRMQRQYSNYVAAPDAKSGESNLSEVVVMGYGSKKRGKVARYRPPASHRIVVLGSSTAEGVGPKTKDSTWVNLFRQYVQSRDPQAEVIILAVGGYNSYKILPTEADIPFNRPDPDTGHNVTKALALEPDIIIINMPSNDIVAGYSVREFMDNLEEVVDRIHEKHVTVYITTTQPRNTDESKRKKLQQMRTQLKRQYRTYSIDCWEGLSAPDGSILPQFNSGDGIHLNGLGHRIMFERIRERVKL